MYSVFLIIGPHDLQEGALKDLLARKCFVIWDPLDLLRTSLGKALRKFLETSVQTSLETSVQKSLETSVQTSLETSVQTCL